MHWYMYMYIFSFSIFTSLLVVFPSKSNARLQVQASTEMRLPAKANISRAICEQIRNQAKLSSTERAIERMYGCTYVHRYMLLTNSTDRQVQKRKTEKTTAEERQKNQKPRAHIHWRTLVHTFRVSINFAATTKLVFPYAAAVDRTSTACLACCYISAKRNCGLVFTAKNHIVAYAVVGNFQCFFSIFLISFVVSNWLCMPTYVHIHTYMYIHECMYVQ